MKKRCIPPESFGVMSQLPEGDALQLHLAACARCQARYLSYQSFMRGDQDRGDAPVEEARPILDALIDRQTRRLAKVSPRSFLADLFHGWRLRALVLVPATCAAVLVAYLVVDTQRASREQLVLRGQESGAPFRLEQAESLPGGSMRFAWRSVREATGYQVRLYTSDLKPLYQTGIQPETTVVLPAERLPSLAGPGAKLFWRVAAFKGTREAALSSVGTVGIPSSPND